MKFCKIVSLALVCLLMMTLCLTACDNNNNNNTTGKKYDNETDPITFSIGELDGVFNPFYSTSAYDSEIVGVTQVSMLSSDEYGSAEYGADVETMTLDYTVTMKDANGNETDVGDSKGTTEYEFLIKNGVKDSEGNPLDISDVLFSLYVYLDPIYNGSSTIYSTNIRGLDDYRGGTSIETTASNQAQDLMENMILYANHIAYPKETKYNHAFTDEQCEEYETYVQKLYALFDEMLEQDWTSSLNGLETAVETYVLVDNASYSQTKGQAGTETYDITEAWELFLITEGLCQYVEIDGKSKTEDTSDQDDGHSPRYYVLLDSSIVDEIAALTAADSDALLELQKELVVGKAQKEYKQYAKVSTLCSALEESMLQYLRDLAYADLLTNGVSSVSGITHYKTTEFNNVTYATEHDVLKIVIDGVDPKAIWNFAFTVAPMEAYASEEEIALYDGVSHFGVKKGDIDYRDNVLKNSDRMGLPIGGGAYMASKVTGGKATSKTDFRSKNVVYFERNVYFYTIGLDSATATETDYAMTEEEAIAAGKKIHNAYIKNLRYQVITSSNVMDAMLSGQIDYSSEISAKQENIDKISQASNLSYTLQDNLGYGYIGINAKYVQDIEVRRLIMYAMDRSIITTDYYTGGLGSIIERPMTTNSWAYPDGATTYYTAEWFIEHYKTEYDIDLLAKINQATSMSYTAETVEDLDKGRFIEVCLQSLGYSKSGGIYQKQFTSSSGTVTVKLEYTFTIAGDTKDHPAYQVFANARDELNQYGWSIKVKNDAQALSKLSNGQLTVWAAAWSSTIDPDLYQVYHKDSKATSVNNWGYSAILKDTTLYKTENSILTTLSQMIDDGRSTLNQSERESIYASALDEIMELAVELPTYQRSNLLVYNSSKIDPQSLNQGKVTAYSGLIENIWELSLL